MKRSRTLICGIVLAGMVCCDARGASPAEVDAAVDKGKAWLLGQQKNGNWETALAEKRPDMSPDVGGAQYSGLTALATYSLLCTNTSRSDPHIVAALDFLSKTQPEGIYALGVRCLLWSTLEKMNKAQHEAAHRDSEKLVKAMRSRGEAAGLYYYAATSQGGDPGSYDHSVSQFGALGLWAMQLQGFEVPGEYWRATDQAWRKHQYPDGAWSYVFNGDPMNFGKHTMPMTCAGVATLLIDEEILHKSNKEANGTDPAIEKGITWIGVNFETLADPNLQTEPAWHIEPYTLFGVSRIGVASGRKYLGNVDWYQRGADLMIRTQLPDGSWPPGPLPPSAATSLALTFLAYGRAPVVLNKLNYNIPDNGKPVAASWNRSPQDCRNFVEWMGRGIEQRLNWQVIDLNVPAEQLHDAPIIYMSGKQAPTLSPPDIDKLHQFVLQGGTIVGNADEGSDKFTKGFEQLGSAMFPAYEFRQLPPTHPIFTHEQFRKWEAAQVVLGLSNGAREFMLLPNHDISHALQSRSTKLRESDYQLLDDIVLYAMDSHGLQEKGITYLVADNASAPIERQIKVARLQYAGNWDPEPYGWQRLASVLHNEQKIALTTETWKLGEGKTTAPLAHLTGTGAFSLTEPQRQDLKEYVNAGRTLVIDAAGGDTPFAAAVQTELEKIFGADAAGQLNEPLPQSHPLYSAGGKSIEAFHYRTFARERLGSSSGPQLRGITLNGRLAVIFSREDLSAGLVGEQIDGVCGYTPETAAELMRNIILSASAILATRDQGKVVETDVSTSGPTVASQTMYDAQITSTDLIDQHSPTFLSMAASGTTNDGGFAFDRFNDGIASTKVTSNDLGGDVFFTALGDLSIAPSVTFNLNLAQHPDGFDISGIKTINGWADTQTFSNQHYTVSCRQVHSTVFTPLASVNYTPFANDSDTNPQNASMVSLSSSAGALITNVAAIRFTFGLPTVASKGSVVREIEVNGQPSTVPAPAAPKAVPTILPLGDSITWGDQDVDGVTAGHGNTPIVGGYRTALYTALNDAKFAFHFVGSHTTNPSSILVAANEVNCEGHNGYQIGHILKNLTGSTGIGGNNGGCWLSGGGGSGRDAVYPNYILLEIGTNDVNAGKSPEAIGADLKELVDALVQLRPDANILMGSIIPRGPQNKVIMQCNDFIQNALVPAEKAQGHHVSYVEQYKNFLAADGSIDAALLPDGTHPSQAGYDRMGASWARAILALPRK